MKDGESAGRRTPGAARRLLRTVRADPRHMPERMAVFAVEFLGPPAAEWAARRDADTDTDTDALATQAVRRGVRTSVVEGSFLGGPFMALLPIAFCGALLAQFRMVLELAALSGRDPTDETAVADLLVIQGVHPTTAQAEAALREARPAAVGGRSGRSEAGWWSTVRSQAYLIGLVTPQTEPRGRMYRAAVWAGTIALVLVGFVVPFVWVPVCAEMYRRATNRLAAVAARHFAQHGGTGVLPPDGPARQRAALRPGLLLVAVRTLVACLTPVVIVVLVLAVDLRVADAHWTTVLIAFFAVGGIAALVWYLRRR